MKLLKELLVDSYSGDYSRIIRVVAGFLRNSTNAEVVVQRISGNKANVIAVFGKPELLINCHLDTVAPANGCKQADKLKETKAKVFGLGVADTKANIYCVLKAVAKSKPGNLMLLFSVDEETDDSESGVAYFLNSGYGAGIKYALVCEPTCLKFVNKHKGYYSYKIVVKSNAKHSSQKQKGSENAIVKAAELILGLSKEGFNVGKIKGGVQGNIVADCCEFVASIRTYLDFETVLEKMKEKMNVVSSVEITPCFIGEPLFPSKNQFPFINSEMHSAAFWSEAALFKKAGISSIVFGVGNIKQAHSSNEFVKKKELWKAQGIFERIVGGINSRDF